ncbi:MAG: bacillithiol biosynthesis deacetylase BshB1 [Acidobacteriota bacterium]
MNETVDVLAIGTHPDDVELCCGGTVARLAAAGRRVGLLHLTRGEGGTRGSAEERLREAERAAEILGAAQLDFLDCGDGALRTGPAEEDALIAVLRRRRPEVVLAPPPRDRHPDHGRASALVEAASFYAGLEARGEGSPHRPGAVFFYMQHHLFEPRFIVDVSATWHQRSEALAAYGSQFYRPDASDGEATTKIATRQFALAVEGRARHFGEIVGAEFGEPFGSRQPLAVGDLMGLIPGGVR